MPTIKKGIICEDENLQNKIYPYTQMDCVYDLDNSTTLDVVVDDIKENLMYVDEIGAYQNVVPINADQLEGHDAAYFESLPVNMDLLWTNASPTASFAAQTIQLDLSEYQMLCIYMVSQGANSHFGQLIIKNPDKMFMTLGYYNAKITARTMTASDTGVDFGSGQFISTYGSNTTDDTKNIPQAIYGIKANITDKTGA